MARQHDSAAERPTHTLSCPFAAVILGRVGACKLAQRCAGHGRNRVTCRDEQAQLVCVDLSNTLRKNANFCLGLTRPSGALRSAQATRLQCGGLLGLQWALDKVENHARIEDIYRLVCRATKRFGDWAKLPLDAIVRGISSYEPNRKNGS